MKQLLTMMLLSGVAFAGNCPPHWQLDKKTNTCVQCPTGYRWDSRHQACVAGFWMGMSRGMQQQQKQQQSQIERQRQINQEETQQTIQQQQNDIDQLKQQQQNANQQIEQQRQEIDILSQPK